MPKLWIKTFLPITFLSLALVLGGFFSVNANAGFPGSYGSGTQACLDAIGSTWSSECTNQYALPPYVTDWVRAPDDLAPYGCTIGYTAGGSYSGRGYNCAGITPPVVCPPAGTSAIPSGQIAYGENALGVSPVNAVLCNSDLCIMKINQGTSIPIGGGKQGNYITSASYTGAVADSPAVCPITVLAPTPKDPTLPKPIDTVTPSAGTPDGVPVSPADCPPGSAFGSVNGVNVCAPSGSKIAYQPETSTQTNNGTTTNSSTERTDTVNPDGSVTSNKTTTSTGAGGATSTTTTTNNTTNNTFGGGDSKEGDSKNIDLGPAPSAESGDVPAIPGIAPGTGQDGAGQAERTFTVGTHFSGSAACIADRSIQAMGITVTVPLSQLCPWFDIMYKVVSLMAVFAALRILVMA